MNWKSPLKRWFAPILYRHPNPSLRPERLYAYLDALWQRRNLEGDILEVGCFRCGTTALAFKMMERTNHPKRYVCIDTFEGFVDEQFANDRQHGLNDSYHSYFADNSIDLVSGLLRRYDCEKVILKKGDIVTLPDTELPEKINVCLLDVDLEIPIYAALKKIVPRLVDGAIVLVDDCAESSHWPGARLGYQRFVSDQNLPEQYFMGMGLVEK